MLSRINVIVLFVLTLALMLFLCIDAKSATYTSKLGLVKPTVNGDTGLWGAMLNSNADTLDNIVVYGERISNFINDSNFALVSDTIPNTLRVATKGGNFTSLRGVFEYLYAIAALGETQGYRIIIDGGYWLIDDTFVVDFPFPVLFEGSGSATTIFFQNGSMAGKVMCEVKSNFDIHKIGIYGNSDSGQIKTMFKFDSDGVYCEFVDFVMSGTDTCFEMTHSAELFCMNYIIEACTEHLLINAPTKDPAIDFEIGNHLNYRRAFNLVQANEADIFMNGLRWITDNASDSVICYNGDSFGYNNTFTVINCEENRTADELFCGFDFTRADGRDADIVLMHNIGEENKNPHAKINILDNTTQTSVAVQNRYYILKVDTATQSSYTCKLKIDNNKVTYLPSAKKALQFWISGNIQCSDANQNINVAICKNGDTATANAIAVMTARCQNANIPWAFSMNAYIDDVKQNDYFQIQVMNTTSAGDNVLINDLHWLIESR